MNRNKGFTLVELLAILVILSIIAVITVPRITRIVDGSKKDAANVSAFGYLDSIEKYYMENSGFGGKAGFKLNGEYTIENGVLKNDDETHNISITGDAPTSGTLYIDRGQVVDGCLTIGGYKVNIIDGNPSGVEQGECTVFNSNSFIANLEGHVETDGYKYLDSPIVFYYDPVIGQKCNSYVDANSDPGVKTGCMRWYIYSLKDNVMYAILDHNLNTREGFVVWCTQSDFENSTILGAKIGVSSMGSGDWGNYGYGNHQKGPLTTLNYLKENTSNWVTSVKGDYAEYQANISSASYHIDYSDYKARLMTAQEVANFMKVDFSEATSTSSVIVSSILIKNLSNNNNRWEGFWLASPKNNSSYTAWYVGYDPNVSPRGRMDSTYITSSDRYGVRPVISLSTSMLSTIIND